MSQHTHCICAKSQINDVNEVKVKKEWIETSYDHEKREHFLPPDDAANSGAFPLADHNITVNSVFYQNGLLKANLSWSSEAPLTGTASQSGTFSPSYVVRWYPKVCLGNERKAHGASADQLLVKPLLTATNTHSVVVYDLNFNCRYAVAIYQRSEDVTATKAIVERLRGVKHFVTPMCQDVQVQGTLMPNCPRLRKFLPLQYLAKLSYQFNPIITKSSGATGSGEVIDRRGRSVYNTFQFKIKHLSVLVFFWQFESI